MYRGSSCTKPVRNLYETCTNLTIPFMFAWIDLSLAQQQHRVVPKP
jgi:hypothetical protein